MLCERCGRENYKHVVCNYCNRKICNNCLKSSKRVTKTEKAFICKDCWSDMKKRTKYKRTMKEASTSRSNWRD
ncbi:MAG: hypothetical protein M1156_00955 [Candidatus Marsarchaeota archaeon]|nr:hypothetical protein [Candidatus Marsarchaeota archaeon]